MTVQWRALITTLHLFSLAGPVFRQTFPRPVATDAIIPDHGLSAGKKGLAMPRVASPPALAALLAAVLLLFPPSALRAAETSYRLGSGDTVNITVFGRTELSGQFPIGPGGTVRLPLLGAVAAAGLTPEAMGEQLSAQLRETLDFETPVTVDVATYRPVYIIGAVARPGEHVFVPGMTVKQAFAKAGGSPTMMNLPQDQAAGAITEQQRLWGARVEERGHLIRLASLDAALAGETQLTLPPDLQPLARLPAIVQQVAHWNSILAIDLKALETARVALGQQKNQLDEEIAALVREGVALSEQAALVEQEINNMQSLKNRGLTTSARMLTLRQMKSDLDANRSRREASLSRARQQKIALEQRLREQESEWQRSRLVERATLGQELELTRIEVQAANDRLAGMTGEEASQATDWLGPSEARFVVTRMQAEGTETIIADAAAPLLPGDILEVVRSPLNATGAVAGVTGAPPVGRRASAAILD